MNKRLAKSPVKVETKNQAAIKATPAQNKASPIPSSQSPEHVGEVIAYGDTDTLLKITKDIFILENNVNEYLTRDGKWKLWRDVEELIGTGITEIQVNEMNPRLRSHVERTVVTREQARQWLIKNFIAEEFQPDFGMIAGCSKDAKEKPEDSRTDDKNNAALADDGLCTLTNIYDQMVCAEKFEDAVYMLDGIGELIKHHPALQPEAEAIRDIAAGELVLNGMRVQSHVAKDQDTKEHGQGSLLPIYDDVICQMKFEAAIHMLENLGITIVHNPALKAEVKAIRAIVAGEGVLQTLRDRYNAL